MAAGLAMETKPVERERVRRCRLAEPERTRRPLPVLLNDWLVAIGTLIVARSLALLTLTEGVPVVVESVSVPPVPAFSVHAWETVVRSPNFSDLHRESASARR
jgi:hypothetical protein